MAIRMLDYDKVKELGLDFNSYQSYPIEAFNVTYVGAVLDDCERNMRDDSDFYAVVWDETEQCVKSVEYATTRFPTYSNHAHIDATPEVKAKAQAWYNARNIAREEADIRAKYAQAYVGATVTVTRGRKVPKGFTGKVLKVFTRVQPAYNGYCTTDETVALVSNDKASYTVKVDYLSVQPDTDFVERMVQAHLADFVERIKHTETNGRSMLYAGLRASDFDRL